MTPTKTDVRPARSPASAKKTMQLPRSPWLTLLLLLAVGVMISGFSLAFSGSEGISWGGSPVLFFWNTLPILLLLGLVWLASGLSWLAVLVTGTLIFLLTGANYFKVMLRDDPMVWSDLFRIREGFQMSGQYDVKLTPLMGVWIAAMIAAAVLLDGDGKLADVMLDELEVEVTADGKGVVTMPTDYRTKRQKGDDYPLAAASSLKKGWAEQADDFADYLTGMTPEQASMLETDKDGKAVDADLLSGCTIRVDQYRDAVAKACTNASALGAAKGDRVSLGVEAENASSDITATDDKDVNAEVDLTVVALTLDADGRVTSAIGDMAEPALTIAPDGGVTAPDTVRSKLELGDSYGMRNASSLGKEWYEHSEGYCSYLKGKTEKEVADIPADGSDADLAALCTISIDALQKAAGDAFENASL